MLTLPRMAYARSTYVRWSIALKHNALWRAKTESENGDSWKTQFQVAYTHIYIYIYINPYFSLGLSKNSFFC